MDVDPAKVQLPGRPQVDDPLIRQVALALLAEVEFDGAGGRLFVESCPNLLAVHLPRHCTSLAPSPDRSPRGGLPRHKLRRAIEFINDRLEEGVSLAETAEAAGVSTSHFSALFRRSTGLSPHQYLIRCRVERAKELLTRGDRSLPLAQVAALTGFSDQAHLTRQFKRVVGVTPAAYRKMS